MYLFIRYHYFIGYVNTTIKKENIVEKNAIKIIKYIVSIALI